MKKLKPSRQGIAAGVRFQIFARDSFTCRYCGRCPPDVVLHVDHIEPVSAGGSNEPSNLITACQDCNSGKAANPIPEPKEPTKDGKLEVLGMALSVRDEFKEAADLMFDHAIAECKRLGEKGVSPLASANVIALGALALAVNALPIGISRKPSKREFLKMCAAMFDEQSQ